MTISFGKILLKSVRPGIEELGRLPGTDIFSDISQYPMAIKTPAILIIRIDSASMCFVNANFIRERYEFYDYFLVLWKNDREMVQVELSPRMALVSGY